MLDCTGARRVEHDRVEARQFGAVERTPVEVAVDCIDRPARAVGRGLQRQDGVARGFGGGDFPRHSKRERAEPGEQVGWPRGVADGRAHRGDQRRFTIGGGLEECARRQADRDPAERDGDRIGLIARFGTIAFVHRQPREPVAFAKAGQRLDRFEPDDVHSLERDVDPLVGEGQLHLRISLRREHRGEQFAQRSDQSEQCRVEDMAFVHVDDLVRGGGVEADQHAASCPPRAQARPAARARGRQIGQAELGRKPVLGERAGDPAGAKIGISRVGEVLELAPAAFGKVTAWRQLVARAFGQRAIVEQRVAGHREGDMLARRADPVTARGDAEDRLAHRSAIARGMAAIRSSAIIPGPASSAARPWSQTASHAASNEGRP